MKKLIFIFLLLLAGPAGAAEYALVNQDNAILENRDFASVPNDPTGKNWRWLPVVVTNPAHDPATQKKTGPVTTVLESEVSRVWTVSDLTAQELDERKEGAVDGLDFLLLELAFDHENRIRILESKAPITKAQFRNALKARLP